MTMKFCFTLKKTQHSTRLNHIFHASIRFGCYVYTVKRVRILYLYIQILSVPCAQSSFINQENALLSPLQSQSIFHQLHFIELNWRDTILQFNVRIICTNSGLASQDFCRQCTKSCTLLCIHIHARDTWWIVAPQPTRISHLYNCWQTLPIKVQGIYAGCFGYKF